MKKFGFLVIAFAFIISCKEGKNQSYLPTSIGGINTISVVVDNQLWKGKVGDKIREHAKFQPKFVNSLIYRVYLILDCFGNLVFCNIYLMLKVE